MNIVIIEDEKLAAHDLANILKQADNAISIQKILFSVSEAIAYFRQHPMPQLIFSDIQLGDGYCFEIFKELKQHIPVIYCTAHDQHALEAFHNNGIAYVLKPYNIATIKEALDKCQYFQYSLSAAKINYDQLLTSIINPQPKLPTLLVNYKNRIIPVKISEVAFFAIENGSVSLVGFDTNQYPVHHTLDELETSCGNLFYRANRQYLINKNSVKEVMHYGYRKLFVSLHVATTDEVLINKNKISDFLHWLQQ